MNLYGDDQRNLLLDTGGFDEIFGLGGNDTIIGGAPSPQVADIYGGGGDDLIQLGAAVQETFYYADGGDGDDTLSALSGSLTGGAGRDRITVVGGSAFGGDGADVLVGGQQGFWPTYSLEGGAGDDTLIGGAYDDVLKGGGGADTLIGGGGVDVLQGGAGQDSLTGGAGADTFRFDGPTAGADDVVTEFASGLDRIALSTSGFGLVGGLGGVAFVNGPAATAAGRTLVYDASGDLYWDSDGTGGSAKVLIAHFDGSPALSLADFTTF